MYKVIITNFELKNENKTLKDAANDESRKIASNANPTTGINSSNTLAPTIKKSDIDIAGTLIIMLEQTILKLKQKISLHERTQKDLLSQLDTLTLKTESTSHLLTDLKISKTHMQKELNRLGDENERLLEALEFFEQELKILNEQLKGVCMDRDAVKELYKQVLVLFI